MNNQGDVERGVAEAQPEATLDIQGDAVCLTYPRCGVSPVRMLERLQHLATAKSWADVKILVVQEDHQQVDAEGARGQHLHCLILFSKKRHLRRANVLFDVEVDGERFHPNVQRCRSHSAWVKYLLKEQGPKAWTPQDWDYVALSEERDKGRTGKHDLIAKMILNGANWDDVLDAHPGYGMIHDRPIHSLISHVKQKTVAAQVPSDGYQFFLDWAPPAEFFLRLSPLAKRVWLHFKRSFTMKEHFIPQTFLYGPPGIGKSFFLGKLMKLMRCCMIPLEDWWDDFQDGFFHLAVLDEFHSSKPITWLKLVVDNVPTTIRQRNKGVAHKTKPLAFLFLSNTPLRQPEQYPNVSATEFAGIARRFGEVDSHGNPTGTVGFEVDQSTMRAMTEMVEMCMADLARSRVIPLVTTNGPMLAAASPQLTNGNGEALVERSTPIEVGGNQTVSPVLKPPIVLSTDEVLISLDEESEDTWDDKTMEEALKKRPRLLARP